MRSIKFPNMFNSNSTQVWKSSEQSEATKQNIALTLKSGRGELFGDPYFGLLLENLRYEPNNYILKDRLIDIIYTQLAQLIPQIYVKREDIHIDQPKGQKGQLDCWFKALNKLDYTINNYKLALIETNSAK